MAAINLPGYLRQAIYVRIERDALVLRDARSGKQLNEPPLVALSNGPRTKLLAVGIEAAAMRGREGVTVVNPFAHPRTPVSDFTVAEVLLREMIRKVRGGRRWWAANPSVVMHLTYPIEGGLTQIEVRALKELGMGAGGLDSTVWEGPILSDEQVLKGKFPTTGEVLQ